MLDKKIIYDLTPFSLLDYPDKTSCIIWFAGCNMRCVYCYNPDIVLGKGKMCVQDALTFLHSRRGLLDGVVLSGGECTLYKEIIPLAKTIKEMGMLVKVDTNGSTPKRIKMMLEQGLIDYVSLDLKALPNKFWKITKSNLFNEFKQTLSILQVSKIDFEVRTTVHSGLLSENDILDITDFLESMKYQGKYYIQNFLNDTPTLGNINQRHNKLNKFQKPNHSFSVEIRN